MSLFKFVFLVGALLSMFATRTLAEVTVRNAENSSSGSAGSAIAAPAETPGASAGATPSVKSPGPSIAKSTARRRFKSLSLWTMSLSYFSWQENVNLSQGVYTDHAHGNMLGNALGLEYEHYFKQRYGFSLLSSFLYGVADVGGTQTTLTYTLLNQAWWGLGVQPQFAYRFAKWIVVTAGPLIVYRNLSLPNDPTGTAAVSGATVNYGATLGLKLRLTKHLETRQDIGALAVNASTFWSINLGYKF